MTKLSGTIEIEEVENHSDGSATYFFDIEDSLKKALIEQGLNLAIKNLKENLDIQNTADNDYSGIDIKLTDIQKNDLLHIGFTEAVRTGISKPK